MMLDVLQNALPCIIIKESLHIFGDFHINVLYELAGARGFEPRMRESKSRALPLGHTPPLVAP